MSLTHRKPFTAAAVSSGTAGILAEGLADLHKAVKGAEFYPQGHPYRNETLQRAFVVFQRLVELRPLVFAVNRRGFMLNGDRVEGSESVLQLAHECVIRRITHIIFLQDLLLYDLDALVRLLSSDPHNSDAAGPQLESGGRTVWINERDVAAVLARRDGVGAEQAEPAGAKDETGFAALLLPSEAAPPKAEGAGAIGQLLRLMARERVDVRYQELGSELFEALRRAGDDNLVLPCLEELLRQHREPSRSRPQREFAIFTFGQLADAAADFLLGSLESKGCPDKERIHQVLAVLGGRGAYRVIERICQAKGLYERRSLAAALVALGSVATAPLLAMLKDNRWFVVRNMVSVIGDLGLPGCVNELRRPLFHKDDRVRKETIRALTKIGGEAAEALLISLLDESDEVLVRRAISSLGQMKSRQAVPAMLKLLERRDLLLKELAVKKELLAALSAIGECSATDRLLKMLDSRGWLAPGRSQELKVAVVATLGVIGDEAALPTLARLATGNSDLAGACREALAAAESLSEWYV